MEKENYLKFIGNDISEKIELSELELNRDSAIEELKALKVRQEKLREETELIRKAINELIALENKKKNLICSITSDEYLQVCDECEKKSFETRILIEKNEIVITNLLDVREKIETLEALIKELNKEISVARRKVYDCKNHYDC